MEPLGVFTGTPSLSFTSPWPEGPMLDAPGRDGGGSVAFLPRTTSTYHRPSFGSCPLRMGQPPRVLTVAGNSVPPPPFPRRGATSGKGLSLEATYVLSQAQRGQRPTGCSNCLLLYTFLLLAVRLCTLSMNGADFQPVLTRTSNSTECGHRGSVLCLLRREFSRSNRDIDIQADVFVNGASRACSGEWLSPHARVLSTQRSEIWRSQIP